MTSYERIVYCRDQINKLSGNFKPQIALILGSGLGNFGENIDIKVTVDYKDIDSFPVSTVPGHAGRFLFGYLDGTPLVCMQGRVHYYEGFPIEDVVLPTRVMGMLGAKVLFLTNAAGGIKENMKTPAMMLIRDHIMLFFPNPLIGENMDELGTRFPDMSHVYDPEICEIIKAKAAELDIPLEEGVYCQLTGPSFETPSEVRLLSSLGGSAVGMSTACEAVAARHMGMKACGISCITNKGAGISKAELSHAEVIEAGNLLMGNMTRLVRSVIPEIASHF